MFNIFKKFVISSNNIFMLEFLLYLSVYEIELRKNSPCYFQTFPFLEFGFVKNAKYNLNFTKITTEMVFGFATKSEIKQISKIKSSQINCKGIKQLSQIQYSINNDTQIDGIIQNKGVLTPYIFTCDEMSTFTLSLNYLNGNKHIDYRCSNSIIYTFMTSFLFLFIFLYYRIYWCRHETQECIFYYVLIDSLLFYCIQDSITSFFFILSENNEYFNHSKSGEPLGHLPSIAMTIFELLSLMMTISCLIVVFLFNFSQNRLKNPIGLCSIKVYVSIQTLNGLLILCTQHCEVKWISYFVPFCFYLIFSFLLLAVPSPFSLIRLGVICSLFGNLFTFALRSFFINETKELLSTHVVLIWLNLVCLITQVSSATFFLVGCVVFNEFNYGNDSDDENNDSNFDLLLDN